MKPCFRFYLSAIFAICFINAQTQTAPDLKNASRFGLLSGTEIKSNDTVIVNRDVGSIHIIDTNLINQSGVLFDNNCCLVNEAITDLDSAKMNARVQGGQLLPDTLSSTTLTQGVYKVTGNALLNGNLTLFGTSQSVFIFNFYQDLILASGAKILLNGVEPRNVFINVDGKLQSGSGSELSGVVMCERKASCTQTGLQNATILSKDTVEVLSVSETGIEGEDPVAPPDIDLGEASSFAVLAQSQITIHDPIHVIGDAGSLRGVNGSISATGTVYQPADCKVQKALSDAAIAYEKAVGLQSQAVQLGSLDGQVLSAGVYQISGPTDLTSTLTLTGDSSENYVFILDYLTVGNGAIVDFGDVKPENIFWAVHGDVIVNENLSFSGIIVSPDNISARSRNSGYTAFISFQGRIGLESDHTDNLTYLFSSEELTTLYQNSEPNAFKPCYADEYFRLEALRDPSIQLERLRQDSISDALIAGGHVNTQYVVPIVFHVVYDPAVPASNISDNQVQNALDVLNADFQNTCVNGVNTDITFCLATTDPQGNTLPGANIPGIIHHNNATLSYVDMTDQNQLTALAGLGYDPNKYYNVWIVSSIDDPLIQPPQFLTGVSRFPWMSSVWDGSFVRYDWMGNNPVLGTTCVPQCSSCTLDPGSAGRTLTHESGHYLGLYHTFHGGCDPSTCSNSGDHVCDTPPAGSFTNGSCSQVFTNSCGVQPDLFNYMEYSAEGCRDRFTQGQRDRMHTFLMTDRSDLVTSANLQDAGVQCTGLLFADFTITNSQTCLGDVVSFNATSTGGGITYTWDFGDGNTATGNPVTHTYASNGQYTVELTVDDGSNQVNDIQNVFIIDCQPISSSQGLWYFGEFAGLDFSTGMPLPELSAYNNATINNLEAVVCQGDPTGNLLFYSDVETIWDQSHQVLGTTSLFPNSATPTQALSVPDPASVDDYYLFYLEGGTTPSNNNLFYQKINTSGGVSSLSGPEINITLPAGVNHVDEQITAIPHCNGQDYWLILHAGSEFLVYSISSTGVSFSNSYTSTTWGALSTSAGYVKASPNGSRLAISRHSSGSIHIFDFDKSNGAISNPTLISDIGGYGLSFSPNSDYLFATRDLTETIWQQKLVVRYDVTGSNPGSTEEIIHSIPHAYTAMQLGPDNKIYITEGEGTALSVINYPDDPVNPGFNPGSVALRTNPSQGIFSQIGLPNMIDAKSIDQTPPMDFDAFVSNCDEVTFIPDQCFTNHSWNFDVNGAGGVTPTNSTVEYPGTVTYSTNGTFTISLTATDPLGSTVTVTEDIVIGIDPPDISGVICAGNNLQNYSITNFDFDLDYEWNVTVYTSPSPTTTTVLDASSLNIDFQGLGGEISVTATDPTTGCTQTTTIQVSGLHVTATATDETCFNTCDGSATANDLGGIAPITYQWDDPSNQTGQIAMGLCAGTYNVVATDNLGCTASATATVNPGGGPVTANFTYNGDQCFTGNNFVFTDQSTNASGWSWDFGDGSPVSNLQNPTHTYTAPGTYTVVLTTSDQACSDIFSLNVQVFDEPVASITGVAQESCDGDCDGEATVIGSGGTPAYTYQWNDPSGQTTQTATGLCDGVYNVVVTDANGCTASATTTISPGPVVTADFIYNGDQCFSGNNVLFTDQSSNATSWSWDFGDGSGTSNLQNPSYSYNASGTFPVTLTVANGNCSVTHTVVVNIFENPEITSIGEVDETCAGLCDGAASVLVSGGTPGYNYSWNDPNNQATSSATALCNGTYTVTVMDANGCTTSGTATVNPGAVGTPDAQPIATTTCLIAGNPVNFTNAVPSDPCLSYMWHFGVGEGTSTQHTPNPYTYNETGTYQVYLTVTDQFGNSDQSSIYVNVYPSTCACNANYDLQGSTSLFTNTTWNPATPMLIEGTVTVPPGITLTIASGSEIQFGPFGKIVIQQDGQLIIEDNATVKGLEFCDHMWQGIEVWGNPSLPSNSLTGHGRVIIGGATISNAHRAITTASYDLCHFDPLNPCTTSIYDYSKRGGRVFLDKTQIRDCGVGIRIPKGVAPALQNTNIIVEVENCVFENLPGNIPDNNYNTTTGSSPYPNAGNPFNGTANPQGRGDIAIYQEDALGATIAGNQFNNWDVGVESYDSRFDVINCSFDNDRYGIRIFNTVSGLGLPHRIESCTFRDIHDPTGSSATTNTAGLQIENGRNDRVISNSFGVPQGIQSNFPNGMYLENTRQFRAEDNDFNSLLRGAIIHNTHKGGGYIGPSINGIDKNIFTNCKESIITDFNNAVLKLRCNIHGNPSTANYDVNWRDHDQLGNQGQMPQGGLFNILATRYPSGNEFSPPTRKQIQNLGMIYTYIHHTDPPMTPSPTFGNLINIANSGVSFTPNNSCKSLIVLVPFELQKKTLMDDIDNEIHVLESELSSVESNLDNGNTASLLNQISGSTNSGQLKSSLLSHSPLSDQVLIAYIERQNVAHGHFRQVMESNTPVSRDVFPFLQAKLESVPQGIQRQIRELLAYNPATRTPAGIRLEIEALQSHRAEVLTALIGQYLAADSMEAAIDYLDSLPDIEARKLLAETYLILGDSIAAANEIVQVPPTGQENIDWLTTAQLRLNLLRAGLRMDQLSSSQLGILQQLEGPVPFTSGITAAKAWLRKTQSSDFPLYLLQGTRSAPFDQSNSNSKSNDLHIYPNPADKVVYLTGISEEMGDVVFELSDMTGKKVMFETLDSKNAINKLSVVDLHSGMYFYRVTQNGRLLGQDKLMISQK